MATSIPTTSEGTTAETTNDADDTTTTTTTTTTATATTGQGPRLVIEGFGDFPTECVDLDCAAKAACELVTGDTCEWVEYDCNTAGQGSYVSPLFIDTPQDFSFGVYELSPDDYGNICSCMRDEVTAKKFLTAIGVATDHVWCGLGNFYLIPG